MKTRLNYKSRKTIIITVAIIALLALSGTGIYLFTKGNDNIEAFSDQNTIIEGSSQPGENQGNMGEEQTVENNTNSNYTQIDNTQETNNNAGTTTSTTSNVPNAEYVTETQEEVEQLVYEGFLVGWTPIQLAAITDNLQLNKVTPEASYTIEKKATLVNGNELIKNEQGNILTKVKAEDIVTYVITLQNTGNVTLQNIKVSDELIGYEETIAVLAIGDKKELTVEYIVNEDDMNDNEEILNIVVATVTDSEKIIEEQDEEIVPVNPYITVSGTKTWVDYNNQENTRPVSITVEVLNGTEVVDIIIVKANAQGNWNYTSNELPKYDENNNVIVYTVREKNISSKYTSMVDKNNITNTIKQEQTQITVNKVWSDGNNQDGNRPTSIKVQLFADNVAQTGKIITLTSSYKVEDNTNMWQYTFTGLNKYDLTDGHVINYEVKELNSSNRVIENNGKNVDYTVTYEKNIKNKTITIVNSYTPKTTSIEVSKVWVDNDNEDKDRPTSVKVGVYNGETKIKEYDLTENNWSYTFTNLPMYSDGKLITYTVKELRTDGTAINNNEQYDDNYVTTYNKNVITNTHEKPIISVTKTSNKAQNSTVKYGDTINYTLTAKNTGNKQGKVTIKDTIPTNTELKGNISVKVGTTVTTTITKEQLAAGHEIMLPKNTTATITFSVEVKAYSGTIITNTASYITEKETQTDTETVIVKVEDTATIIPTITTTTPVTIPQKAILVLDFSGSMDDKINGTKKIKSLKTAVNTFLDTFLENGKNEVMIIAYAKDTTITCNFTKNKNTAYNSIKDREADGETNIDAGLSEAYKYITNDSHTSVILMTDGLPSRYRDNTTGKAIQTGNGNKYEETAANEAKESAGWIKNKGSKIYSIGFGLDSINNQDNSRNKVKQLLKDIATSTEQYYDTFKGEELEQAFKDIVESITTTSNKDPIVLNTTNGIINITQGFKEGQKIQVYTTNYSSSANPTMTYTWTQFLELTYTTYNTTTKTIVFDLGKYMEANNIAMNTDISLRFID